MGQDIIIIIIYFANVNQGMTKVTIDDLQEVAYALLIGVKINTLDDLEGPLRTMFQNRCVFRSPPGKFE